MANETVVIKKYGNRRLYDTSGSRYVNLEDIAALVRNGTDVQVLDAKTSADLTGSTLTQIIAEDAKGHPKGLPLELLKQLIVTSDHVGQEFIMWYLKSAFDTYQKVQGSLQERMTGLRAAALSPLQTMKDMLKGQPEEQPAGLSPEVRELRELRQRVAELEALQKKSRPGRKKRVQPKR
jgi:polyhydroxyalkanoate synthesis repressor PhaR